MLKRNLQGAEAIQYLWKYHKLEQQFFCELSLVSNQLLYIKSAYYTNVCIPSVFVFVFKTYFCTNLLFGPNPPPPYMFRVGFLRCLILKSY